MLYEFFIWWYGHTSSIHADDLTQLICIHSKWRSFFFPFFFCPRYSNCCAHHQFQHCFASFYHRNVMTNKLFFFFNLIKIDCIITTIKMELRWIEPVQHVRIPRIPRILRLQNGRVQSLRFHGTPFPLQRLTDRLN